MNVQNYGAMGIFGITSKVYKRMVIERVMAGTENPGELEKRSCRRG